MLSKLGLLATLYFSQGLPFGFFTQSLPVMLRKSGFSLGAIGLTSLLALPWALKFLWAPLVDRYFVRSVGRRRSWILPLQLAGVLLLLSLAALEYLSDGPHFELLLTAVFLINLISATQDIATDGLAVDLLKPRERGLANGIQVAGYRVGMIVGGGALLILLGDEGGPLPYLMMALMLALASVPIVLSEEPSRIQPETKQSGANARASLWAFLRRPRAAPVLLLLVLYKLGDAFATGMLRPFLVDRGYSTEAIGWMLGTLGFIAGLLGAVAGGAAVGRVGRKRSLVAFAAFQALTVLLYALIALFPAPAGDLAGVAYRDIWVGTAVTLEHFAGGMATAALFTCMMDWCDPASAATDYTIQASAVVVASGIAAALAGFSADALGYAGHFLFAFALAAMSVVGVAVLFPQSPPGTPASD